MNRKREILINAIKENKIDWVADLLNDRDDLISVCKKLLEQLVLDYDKQKFIQNNKSDQEGKKELNSEVGDYDEYFLDELERGEDSINESNPMKWKNFQFIVNKLSVHYPEIKKGSFPNALIKALRHDRIEHAKLLVENGAGLYDPETGECLIHEVKSVELIEFLFKYFDNIEDKDKFEIFLRNCKDGNLEVVKYLVEQGEVSINYDKEKLMGALKFHGPDINGEVPNISVIYYLIINAGLVFDDLLEWIREETKKVIENKKNEEIMMNKIMLEDIQTSCDKIASSESELIIKFKYNQRFLCYLREIYNEGDELWEGPFGVATRYCLIRKGKVIEDFIHPGFKGDIVGEEE
jgi:hypothetical protein